MLTTLSFQHDGNLPKTMAEKKEFKASILAMRIKPNEENFEEAEGQAVRLWSEKGVRTLVSIPIAFTFL